MARGYTSRGYTGFSYWVSWECGACGERGDIQGEDLAGDVSEYINHYCEVDEES